MTLIDKLRMDTREEMVRTEAYLKRLETFERSLYVDPTDEKFLVAQELTRNVTPREP